MRRKPMQKMLFRAGAVFLLLIVAVGWITFTARHYPRTAFLNICPSSVWIANAVEILQEGRGFYKRDPGVSYYLFLAAALVPLKLATFFSGIDLTEFLYVHFAPVITYLQFMTMAAALTGLYLASRAAVRVTGREWIGPVSVLGFLAISPINYRWITAINTEGFLICISGLILFLFARYVTRREDRRGIYPCFFLAGVGFAAKATIAPIVLFLFLFLLFECRERRIPAKECAGRVAKGACAALLGFIIPASVLGRDIFHYFGFLFRIATHSGTLAGSPAGFNTRFFFRNIHTLFVEHSFLLIAAALVILVRFVYRGTDKRDTVHRRETGIALVGVVSLIVFAVLVAEDLRPRYLIAGFVLEVFTMSLLVSALVPAKRRLAPVLFLLALLLSVRALGTYREHLAWRRDVMQEERDTVSLIEAGRLDQKRDRIVYTYCVQTKESFFMKGNAFSHFIYAGIIGKYQPNFFRYKKKRIRTNRNKTYRGSWDYALILKRERDAFMEKYPSALVAQRGRYALLRSREP
jgi:hypothetical protein